MIPWRRNDNPLQYSCLGNPTDRAAWVGCIPWDRKRVECYLVTKWQQKVVARTHPQSILKPSLFIQGKHHTKAQSEGFPRSPLVKNLLSNAEGVGLIPGQGAKIPHALWTKQTLKKRRSNIVTNSKEFWNGSHQIKVLNTHTERKQNSAWVETKQSQGTYSMQLQWPGFI